MAAQDAPRASHSHMSAQPPLSRCSCSLVILLSTVIFVLFLIFIQISYPLFLPLKPLQTRGHDRDGDGLPLDMSYAILEC